MSEKVDSVTTYIGVFTALMVLLVLTVLAYYIPFEKWNVGDVNLAFMNTVVALLIALVKASMVIMIFMHVRHSSKLTWVFASAAFVWLVILFVFTMADYSTRGVTRTSDNAPMSAVTPQDLEH